MTTESISSPTGKVKLFHRGSDIDIVRKWRGWHCLYSTPFALLWDGFVFIMFVQAVEQGSSLGAIFLLIFVVVGVWLTYSVSADWLNRTHVLVSYDKIKVRHYPLPWRGNKDLSVLELSELRARETMTDSQEGTSREYWVSAKSLSGEVTLAKRFCRP